MTTVKPAGTGTGSAANLSRDNSPTETIRKLEDSFAEREVEQNKKHHQELVGVNELHKEELQKIQDSHERSLRDIKARSEDTITKQDMNYQKEMKDMKDMYEKRLEKLALQNKRVPESGT